MTKLEELEKEVELLREIVRLKEKLLEIPSPSQQPTYPPYPLYPQPYIGDPPPYRPYTWYSNGLGYGTCTSTTDHTIPCNKEGYPG